MNKAHLERFYRNKPILITGGLGFIGSNLAIQLVSLGAKVTIVDALIPGLGGDRFNIELVKEHVALIISDLRNLTNLRKALKNQEIIFNLAGSHSHIDSMHHPVKDLSATCETQLSLLEVCRKVNPEVKIITAGTRNQYGKPKYLPVDENHPLRPLDINGAHWLAVENYHLLYHRVYGLKTCLLRISNTYGPRHQMKHPYQGVLNWFIRLVLDEEPITLFGDGKQKRDAVYVDDEVEAFLLVGASKKVWGEVYNVGGETTSLRDFVERLIIIYGKGEVRTTPFPTNHKRIEPGDFATDWRKIQKELGWAPRTKLDKGIRKTVEFYQKYKKYYW